MALSTWLSGIFCVVFVHAIHDADVLNLYKNTYTGDVSTYFIAGSDGVTFSGTKASVKAIM